MTAVEKPDLLLSEETIQARVTELALRISADYEAVEELLLVGVLRGCYVFLADLSRRLTIQARIDFIALSSYGQATKTTGAVRLVMDLRADIEGKHILIVEDIVDTGHTLRYLMETLEPRGPASLKTCALLRKPSRLDKDVTIDYLGFDVPDRWVVGYGMDGADRYRALPYIGVVKAPGQ
jgi:hypoxanthine phosphoribosyltransferase